MSQLKVCEKWPASKRRFTVRWGAYLAPPGETPDTIATSSWTADAGIEIAGQSFAGTNATVWLRGGTVGQRYKVTNTMTSTAGAEEQKSFYVDVKEEG